jgi:cell division septum initiation protein DivIVA
MRYTPVELRHVRFTKSLFGYKRHEIDKVIEDVADSFEVVWRERGELADKLEDVEKILADVKQRESLLTSTLVAAERTAADAIETAKKQGELIIAEAHQEARAVTRAAAGERERLFAEVRRIETLLRAALGMVEETRNELPPAEGAPAPAPIEHWPARQDTREFQAVELEPPKLPPMQSAPEPADDNEPWSEAKDFAWG